MQSSTVAKHVNEETHKIAIKFLAQKEEGTKFWKEQVKKVDHEAANEISQLDGLFGGFSRQESSSHEGFQF